MPDHNGYLSFFIMAAGRYPHIPDAGERCAAAAAESWPTGRSSPFPRLFPAVSVCLPCLPRTYSSDNIAVCGIVSGVISGKPYVTAAGGKMLPDAARRRRSIRLRRILFIIPCVFSPAGYILCYCLYGRTYSGYSPLPHLFSCR